MPLKACAYKGLRGNDELHELHPPCISLSCIREMSGINTIELL